MLFCVILHKDVMILSFPKGLKDGENKGCIITASNNPVFDDFANCLTQILKIK